MNSTKLFFAVVFNLVVCHAICNTSNKFENEDEVVEALKDINRVIGSNIDSSILLVDSLIDHYEKMDNQFAYARALSFRSWPYMFHQRYEEGLKDCFTALKIQEKIHDSVGIAKTKIRIGLLHLETDEKKNSISYLQEALTFFTKISDHKNTELVNNNIGVAFFELNQFDTAIVYFKKSLEYRIENSTQQRIGYSLFNIGAAYLEMNNLDSAQKYLFDAKFIFGNKTKRKKVPHMVYLAIGEYYAAKGQHDKSIEYNKRGIAIAEDWGQTDVLIEGYRNIAIELQKNKELEEALYYLNKWIDLKAKFDSTNNASEMMRLKTIYETEKKDKEIALLTIENIKAQQNVLQIAFASIILVILITVSIWLFFKNKSDKQKLSEARLNKKLAEIKLQAIQSQMNPHFIFNCINTAQHFVIHEQREEAYDYLTKFARLLRLVLENSDSNYIDLQEELEQIQLYIDLEAIRFDNTFTSSITVDNELSSGVFLIPRMILQPIVENAIIHGLVNRSTPEGGLLSISFQLVNDHIQCEIVDNGIGRVAAREIKSKKAGHFKSKALPNIEDMMSILKNDLKKNQLTLEIEDLYTNNQPTGTRVSIDLPYK